MEFVYLWVKEYKNIKNLEFNLNPGYKVDFNQKDYSIKIKKKKHFNIFGEKINIIALAGKNGCGKSNIIDILKQIFDNTINHDMEESFEYVLIIKRKGRGFQFLSTPNLFDKIISANNSISLYKQPIKSILFRQFYRHEDFQDEAALHKNSPLDNYREMYKQGCFCYDRFQQQDVFFALAKMYNNINNRISKIWLFQDNPHLEFNFFRINIKVDNKHLNQKETVRKIYKSKEKIIKYFISQIQKELSDNTNELQTELLIHMTYALKRGIANFKNYIARKPVEKIRILPYEISYLPFIEQLKQIQLLVYDWNEEVNGKEAFEEFLELSNFYIRNYYGGLDNLYEKVQRFCKKHYHISNYKSDNILDYIDINFEGKYVRKFFKSISQVDFTKYVNNSNSKIFSFMQLSTGEQRLLGFIADLITIYSSEEVNKKIYPQIIFLDEIDLSWHPEWQRKLILYLVDTITSILPANKNITFIISTHSPFILSDIPRENIILLGKDPVTNKCYVSKETVKTFGTNIHTLLANNFFMESTIGAFAERTIKKVVKNIRNNQDQEFCDNIIELMDDGIYKTLIKNMKLYRMYDSEGLCDETN